ncbi:MAG: ComC/BlpC family leader-containing pheromone/bacteriocin [Bacteroidales bacterium]|nr:ComC/BlpC family leader-containing pheromone/bacteriocin [Bacteroidales bacterium]
MKTLKKMKQKKSVKRFKVLKTKELVQIKGGG